MSWAPSRFSIWRTAWLAADWLTELAIAPREKPLMTHHVAEDVQGLQVHETATLPTTVANGKGLQYQ